MQNFPLAKNLKQKKEKKKMIVVLFNLMKITDYNSFWYLFFAPIPSHVMHYDKQSSLHQSVHELVIIGKELIIIAIIVIISVIIENTQCSINQ